MAFVHQSAATYRARGDGPSDDVEPPARSWSGQGLALAPELIRVQSAEGRDRVTRPPGPAKRSSSLALPDMVHPLLCTTR